jgi:hypothetical protein
MTLRSSLSDRFGYLLIAIYLLMSLGMFCLIWRATGHHFNYSLDDPLIHLSVAQGIAGGTYGINPGETSSPSSSVLWPFLLAPFVHRSFSLWVPFAVNTILSIAACFLLSGYVRRWYFDRNPRVSLLFQLALAVLLVIAANLVGLTYIGMEHVLQVLLVIGCCWGIMEAYNGNPVPRSVLVMAALAPAVRYEDLAFTLAVALVCLAQRRPRAAALTFGLSLVPLLGMSWFLHAHGLGFLPNSVLLKGGGDYTGPNPLLFHLRSFGLNLYLYFRNPGRTPITLMVILVGILAWQKRHDALRFRILLAVLLACGLMMLIGPYGWFYRYDVCLRVFAFLVLLGALAEMKRFTPLAALALAAVAAVTYLNPLRDTPEFAREIFVQQRQMARFAGDYYRGNVAVNDIGWVSYTANHRYYVLDLFGLASPEAMKAKKTTEWMDDITRRHQIGLVMIYKDWFPPAPPSWREIGELKLTQGRRLFVAGTTVTFYATPEADLPHLQAQLADFARTLPAGASMTFPTSTEMTSLSSMRPVAPPK